MSVRDRGDGRLGEASLPRGECKGGRLAAPGLSKRAQQDCAPTKTIAPLADCDYRCSHPRSTAMRTISTRLRKPSFSIDRAL
jgi:hypothetical protein